SILLSPLAPVLRGEGSKNRTPLPGARMRDRARQKARLRGILPRALPTGLFDFKQVQREFRIGKRRKLRTAFLIITGMMSTSVSLEGRSIMLRNGRMEMATPILGIITLLVVMPSARAGEKLTKDEAHKIGLEAYIYGSPLVTIEMTRRVVTNVAEPAG